MSDREYRAFRRMLSEYRAARATIARNGNGTTNDQYARLRRTAIEIAEFLTAPTTEGTNQP
jgi:hypothetical protein